MSKESKQRVDIAEADSALDNLLETLLAEVPSADAVAPQPVAEAPADVSAPAPVDTVPEPEVSDPVPAQDDVLNESEVSPIQDSTAQEEQAEQAAEIETPAWVEHQFKALVVKVGGQRVAVPLICLNSIARLNGDDGLTPMPGQPAWHRGVMKYRDAKVVVVDPAALLPLNAGETQSEFLLVIGEGHYGLCCDAIEEPAAINADSVRWRQQGDRREWMLGMLNEQMCVLLDVDAIAGALAQGARSL